MNGLYSPGSLPRFLYRVQDDQSYTHFDDELGFWSQASYHTRYDHWINAEKLNRHLDWNARPEEPSPFISVFDNEDEARERALTHLAHGRTGVFIARICTNTVWRDTITTNSVTLPVWRRWADDDGMLLIPPASVCRLPGIRGPCTSKSEWFVCKTVPIEFVDLIVRFVD